MIFLKHNHFRD